MESEKVVIKKHVKRYRFFPYIPKYGKLYNILRVVIALGVGGIVNEFVVVSEGDMQLFFVLVVIGVTAVTWTMLIHGINFLLDKVFWCPVEIKVEFGDRFMYYEDGVCLHDFALDDVVNISGDDPGYEEKELDDGRSIRKMVMRKNIKITYMKNGKREICDLSNFLEWETSKIIEAFKKRDFNFNLGRIYREGRWLFGIEANRSNSSASRSTGGFSRVCQIFENGDMTFPFREGTMPVYLHNFEEFYDVSHQREHGPLDMKLCAVDNNGKEHYFDCGNSGRLGCGDAFEFSRLKERISLLTGKPMQDATTSEYDPNWDDDDDEYENEGLSGDDKKKRKEELNWDMAHTMVNSSLEIDRIEALGLDEETTAKLVGMEIGSSLSKVHDLNEQKKTCNLFEFFEQRYTN